MVNTLRKQRWYNLTALALSLLTCSISFAQGNTTKLSAHKLDFGRIAAIAYPAQTIEFTNTSNNKLAILLIEKGPNVRVNFERRFFGPGEKGIIKVHYEVRNLGDFNEEMIISTNLDTDPLTVTLTGTCISVQECFPDIHNLLKRNVTVINNVTQAPVPNAVLTLIHNHNTQKPVTLKMDKNGKAVEVLPIGLYKISSIYDGFEPFESELFIPKTYPNLVIELSPKQTSREALPAAIRPVPVSPIATAEAAVTPTVTSAELPENKYAANNIVLLLDVSGSMNAQGKSTLLKQAINNLAMILRPIDYVTIITYANEAKVVLPPIPGNETEKITNTVQDLVPHGNTQGVKGLNMAYDIASKQFIKDGNNQVILATDGEFSEKGITDEYYHGLISGHAHKGTRLSILGFGVNKLALERMKKMAASGQGSYIHINTEKFAKTILIDEIKAMSFIEGIK